MFSLYSNRLRRYFIDYVHLKTILSLHLFALFPLSHLNAETLNDDKNLSIHLGSYVQHIGGGDHTENFRNKLIDIEYKVSDYTSIIDRIKLGTLINSSGNRCLMLGVQKTYYDFSSRLSFEGTYTYAGEFFFDTFNECRDRGIYKTFKEETGIGFAPYLYHGLEYDFTENISLEAGIILPHIFVLNFQFNF